MLHLFTTIRPQQQQSPPAPSSITTAHNTIPIKVRILHSLLVAKKIIARFNFPVLVAKKRISFLFQKSDMLLSVYPCVYEPRKHHRWILCAPSCTLIPGCKPEVMVAAQGWLSGTHSQTNIAATGFRRHCHNQHLHKHCYTDNDENIQAAAHVAVLIPRVPSVCSRRGPPAHAQHVLQTSFTNTFTSLFSTTQLRLRVETHNTSPSPTHYSPTGRSQDRLKKQRAQQAY